jgi:hypothetical protein
VIHTTFTFQSAILHMLFYAYGQQPCSYVVSRKPFLAIWFKNTVPLIWPMAMIFSPWYRPDIVPGSRKVVSQESHSCNYSRGFLSCFLTRTIICTDVPRSVTDNSTICQLRSTRYDHYFNCTLCLWECGSAANFSVEVFARLRPQALSVFLVQVRSMITFSDFTPHIWYRFTKSWLSGISDIEL